MGIGKLGDVVFRRKFRWIATIKSKDGKTTHLEPTFVKVDKRPVHDSEKECSQSNDFVYDCKYTDRQFTTITIFDASNEGMTTLYHWLATIYDFGTNPQTATKDRGLAEATVHLQLVDGVGTLCESFVLKDCFPTQINFGDLDYSSSDTCEIELTFSYTELEWRDEMGIANTKKQ
jgi:hypothetical protein